MNDDDKFVIPGLNGGSLGRLNSALLRQQQVSDEQHAALIMSHQLKEVLFDAARKSLNEPLKLKMLAAVFDSLEFEQQELWNFPRDANFHFFWSFPGCTCPKMDNRERLGTGTAIRMNDCPIHGGVKPQKPPTPEQKAIAGLLESYRSFCAANGGAPRLFDDVPSVRAAKKLL